MDSQADITVIRIDSLVGNFSLNKSEIIEVKGVVNEPILSLGYVNIDIFVEDIKIKHKFHVMPVDFNIPSDGIIGKDFIKLYEGVLDYGKHTFTIRTHLKDLVIPMHLFTRDNEIVLPARSEVTRVFTISVGNPSLVTSKEISPGIFTSNVIVKQSGEIPISIVNTTDETKTLKLPTLETIDLNKFNIYNANKTKTSDERTKNLLRILRKSYPKETKLCEKLDKLCAEYSDVFQLETDTMSVNNFYTQKLRITSDESVYKKNNRAPHTHKMEIAKQVKKLLSNDLIEPSVANYNSPVILVPKKGSGVEKRWRMCIDYREVNKKLIPDRFPLPRIDEILDNLGKAKFFSVVDLFSGFHQVPLDKNSREITTFSTEQGSFQWKVLPFGLNVSPNSFSRMMSIAFSGLPPERAFLYIDDIIVVGKSENDHLSNLKSVFDILRKYNLKINPEKCEFFKHEVTFLGHRCSAQGILPDDRKLKSVTEYARPHDKDAVRRFVAFANYYRKFIQNFAEISFPLTQLTRKKIDFKWTDIEENAFEKLKQALISPQILQYPDFEKKFILKVDSSSLGCGGALLQHHNGIDLPVAYFSRTFKKGELNKAIIEKELLAIYHAIMAFRPYIYGKQFTVYTDHKPLIYLFTMVNPASKLVRIKLELEEYDFDIVHIPGKDNVVADALSRIPFSEIRELSATKAQVFAVTRSMTKKINDVNKKKMEIPCNKDENNENTTIFEELTGFNKKIPRIRTWFDEEKNELQVCAYLGHIEIFQVRTTVNEGLNLSSILLTLEKAAVNSNFNLIQWPKDDEIFNYVTYESFIEDCEKILKKIKIAMVKEPRTVDDKEEREKLLKLYHDDHIRGGHCGQKRMYARLRYNTIGKI